MRKLGARITVLSTLLVALGSGGAVSVAATPVSPADGASFTVGDRVKLQARYDAHDTPSAPAEIRLSTSRSTDAGGLLNASDARGTGSTAQSEDDPHVFTFDLGVQRKPTKQFWQPVESRCVKQYDYFPQYCEVSQDVPGPVRAFTVGPRALSLRLGGSNTYRPRGLPAFAVPTRCSATCSLAYTARAYVRARGGTLEVRRLRVAGRRSATRIARLVFPAVRHRRYLRRLIHRYGTVRYDIDVTALNGSDGISEFKSVSLRIPRPLSRPGPAPKLSLAQKIEIAISSEAYSAYGLSVNDISACRGRAMNVYSCNFTGTKTDLQGNTEYHLGTALVTVRRNSADARITYYR